MSEEARGKLVPERVDEGRCRSRRGVGANALRCELETTHVGPHEAVSRDGQSYSWFRDQPRQPVIS